MNSCLSLFFIYKFLAIFFINLYCFFSQLYSFIVVWKNAKTTTFNEHIKSVSVRAKVLCLLGFQTTPCHNTNPIPNPIPEHCYRLIGS